ncbi:hypothetical protein GCM10010967_06150 [Dyadobacter beijingensis]|uniref:Glycosyltransferase involved in cell wall biosynthesis n=1 Tax=Dyadobacter beijingensis TaxID=365489 RepID=A0ABQ2HFC1_9BACT|nr:glycosyltransferase family 4 protein [Dyadobacter beijingensis]GGM77314.1 hypothetical protein GCM10010967_06150 [Dyadobacter beijingensis]
MKRNKLLYILHDIQIGGVEVALLSAVPELSKRFDLKIMVLGSIDANMTSHLTPAEKACFHTFDSPLGLYPITIFKMIGFIRRFAPDMLICSLWRASLLGIITKSLRPETRFVSFVHNTAFFHRLDRIFTQTAIRKADAVFTDSRATADFVKASFKPAIPVNVISFFITESPEIKTAPALDHRTIRFMFLGRINPVKNLPLAIDTIQYLSDRGYDATLDIYGRDDGMLATVNDYIRARQLEDRIQFRGEVNSSQKLEAFKNHHFLIQLSANEGMAMSVAEAIQNGLVCFVTAVGEIPNYATDMQTAVFADISTPEAFRLSLQKLETVVADADLYDRISSDGYAGFRQVGTYSESLIENIDEILPDKVHAGDR